MDIDGVGGTSHFYSHFAGRVREGIFQIAQCSASVLGYFLRQFVRADRHGNTSCSVFGIGAIGNHYFSDVTYSCFGLRVCTGRGRCYLHTMFGVVIRVAVLIAVPAVGFVRPSLGGEGISSRLYTPSFAGLGCKDGVESSRFSDSVSGIDECRSGSSGAVVLRSGPADEDRSFTCLGFVSRQYYFSGACRRSKICSVGHEGERERIYDRRGFLDIGEGHDLITLLDIQERFAADAGP